MTTPDPDNLQTKIIDITKALIEAFTGLSPLLAYGGLILITALVIFISGGGLPNVLLVVPIIVIAAYLVEKLGMRWLEMQDKKNDSQPEEIPPLEPTESAENSPENGTDDISPKEWERRYLDHLTAIPVANQFPL